MTLDHLCTLLVHFFTCIWEDMEIVGNTLYFCALLASKVDRTRKTLMGDNQFGILYQYFQYSSAMNHKVTWSSALGCRFLVVMV